jgi:ABC-type uncharacterized transport system permease subunit
MVQEELKFLVFSWPILAMLYLGLSFTLAVYLRRLDLRALRLSQWGLSLGGAIHWALLFFYMAQTDLEEPSLLVASSFFSALAVLACSILCWQRKALAVVVLALPLTGAGMILGAFFLDHQEVIRLPSVWLWTHVVLMIMGELAFFFAAIFGSLFLLNEYRLRRRGDLVFLQGVLSSLPAIEEWMLRLLWNGFFLLSAGLLMGVLFAREFWSGSWWLDSKVILALVSWLAYGAIIGLRLWFKNFRGTRLALSVIFAFLLAVCLSVLGDYSGPSRHRASPVRVEAAP